MKLTMYELLGMIKDGKAPNKIIFENQELKYDKDGQDYITFEDGYLFYKLFSRENISFLNDEIEILDDEDEEKGLPEKLEGIDSLFEIGQDLDLKGFLAWQKANNKMIENKINEIIDYLEKQRKGNEDE